MPSADAASTDVVLTAFQRAALAVEEGREAPRPYHDTEMVRYLGLPTAWVEGPESIMTEGEKEMMRVVSSSPFSPSELCPAIATAIVATPAGA